jgi:hypothetical protein
MHDLENNIGSIIVKAFIAFCIFMFISEFLIFTPLAHSVYTLSNYTGIVYPFPYMFGLFFVIMYYKTGSSMYHTTIVRLLLGGAAAGGVELLYIKSGNFYPFQPLIAVILPIFWYALLNAPAVTSNFNARNKITKQGEDIVL